MEALQTSEEEREREPSVSGDLRMPGSTTGYRDGRNVDKRGDRARYALSDGTKSVLVR